MKLKTQTWLSRATEEKRRPSNGQRKRIWAACTWWSSIVKRRREGYDSSLLHFRPEEDKGRGRMESVVLKPEKLDIDYDRKEDVLYISVASREVLQPSDSRNTSAGPRAVLLFPSRKGCTITTLHGKSTAYSMMACLLGDRSPTSLTVSSRNTRFDLLRQLRSPPVFSIVRS